MSDAQGPMVPPFFPELAFEPYMHYIDAHREASRAKARQRVSADLRQAIWEASCWLSLADLRIFCDGVIAEIERDEP